MDQLLSRFSERLASVSDRRGFMKLVARVTGGAVATITSMSVLSTRAAASDCPTCTGGECRGCYYSDCPSGCTGGYSWSCCVGGCLFVCQDCSGGPCGRLCVCGGYALSPQPNHPCVPC